MIRADAVRCRHDQQYRARKRRSTEIPTRFSCSCRPSCAPEDCDIDFVIDDGPASRDRGLAIIISAASITGSECGESHVESGLIPARWAFRKMVFRTVAKNAACNPTRQVPLRIAALLILFPPFYKGSLEVIAPVLDEPPAAPGGRNDACVVGGRSGAALDVETLRPLDEESPRGAPDPRRASWSIHYGRDRRRRRVARINLFVPLLPLLKIPQWEMIRGICHRTRLERNLP